VKLLTEAFPIRGTSLAEPRSYLDQESDTVTLTLSEARSFRTAQNAKQGVKPVRSNEENRTS